MAENNLTTLNMKDRNSDEKQAMSTVTTQPNYRPGPGQAQ